MRLGLLFYKGKAESMEAFGLENEVARERNENLSNI